MHSVLVYNVTHSDLILGIKLNTPVGNGQSTATTTNSTTTTTATNGATTASSTTFIPGHQSTVTFARPKFSFVEPVARKILQRFLRLSKHNKPEGNNGTNGADDPPPLLHADVIDFDRYYLHSKGTARSAYQPQQLVVGFSFAQDSIIVPFNTLHLRGSAEQTNKDETEAEIVSAFIPLSTQLIPDWISRIAATHDTTKCFKYILLVCGTGRPQDLSASIWGNSTLATAELISCFLKEFVLHKIMDNTEVSVIDSSAFDVFDYDENVKFIRTMLMPRVEHIRRLAAANAKDWRTQMEVTVCLTEGSPARLGALSAALRAYKPWYAHLCQLKTFWHEKRLLSSDIRFYSFERVETTPPLVVEDLSNKMLRSAVEELCKYRDEFQQTMFDSSNELTSFWLRKSGRPVLSVLVVASNMSGYNSGPSSPYGSPKQPSSPPYRYYSKYLFYRGINLEVSQPTGSLCSERNAIGSALAANPGLNRRDVKLVCVLALPLLSTLKAMANSSDKPSNPPAAPPDLKRVRSESIRSIYELGEGADVNPLGPCGACTEWLKKIAEVNPDFKVLTFRDISCRECFVREVE